jgi:hypothetical protein
MMKQKPVVLRQRRQEEGLSHEIMGNSVKEKNSVSQKKSSIKSRPRSNQGGHLVK